VEIEMADEHEPAAGHDEPAFETYIKIFAALCVCTALSFVINFLMGQNSGSMMLIMLVAVVKAILVAAIFMHLKFDWSKLYFLVFPVLILAVMIIIVLLPDIVLAWHR
jgi:caa(3)-type oxidase subunit IV